MFTNALVIIPLMLLFSLAADWIERRAVRIDIGECMPPFRFVQWGWCGDVMIFHLKLPSWSYEYHIQRNRYALGQRVVAWSSLAGWFTYFHFPTEDL